MSPSRSHTDTLGKILDFYEADAKLHSDTASMLQRRQAQLGREALAALLADLQRTQEELRRLAEAATADALTDDCTCPEAHFLNLCPACSASVLLNALALAALHREKPQ